jgi:putative sugar O-methyltransferase
MTSLDTKIIEQIDQMTRCIAEQPRTDLYGPAAFWESLGEKHKDLLKESGFEKFKQTINFEYHQYEISSIADRKILRLFRLLLEAFQIPYGMVLTRIDANGTLKNVSRVRPDFSFSPRLYSFFMGLYWQYALIKDRIGCLSVCDEPLTGGPIPVTYQGKLVSQDLATSSMELNCIAAHIDMSKVKKIAEIGAGYGRLANLAASTYAEMEYCIFDIPPALAISQNYLAQTMGEGKVRMFSRAAAEFASMDKPSSHMIKAFLPHQLECFPDGYFDLVINISSFDEMSREQVENYFSLIDRKCNGWLYLKGHKTAPRWCDVSGGGLSELPYKRSWRLDFQAGDPLVSNFEQRIYSTHPKN